MPAAATRPGRWTRSELIVVAVAMATTTGLALWGLGRRSFWLDEGISLGATHQLVQTWRGTGGTMALYYALLAPWSALGDDPAWLRLLSVVLVTLSLPVVYAVGRRVGGPRIAAIGTLCTAAAWIVIRYAQEARSFALVLLLSSLSWLALVAAVQAEDPQVRTRWWRLFAVVTVLAPLAHGLAVLQFGAQLVLLLVAPGGRDLVRRLGIVLVPLAATLAVLAAYGAADVAAWVPPLSERQLEVMARSFTGPRDWAALVLGAATVAGAVVAVTHARRQADPMRRWLALVPAVWGLLPISLLLLLSVVRPYFMPRYVIASAPGIGLLLAIAAVGFDRRTRAVRAVLVLVPVTLALISGQLALHRANGDDWRSPARMVAADARPGDAVAFPYGAVRAAFDVAWLEQGGAATPEAISPSGRLGEVRRFYDDEVDADALGSVLADGPHDRIWLVHQANDASDALDAFLEAPEVAEAFRVTRREAFAGDITVVLLERRPSP
jgi:mannosyltransferase